MRAAAGDQSQRRQAADITRHDAHGHRTVAELTVAVEPPARESAADAHAAVESSRRDRRRARDTRDVDRRGIRAARRSVADLTMGIVTPAFRAASPSTLRIVCLLPAAIVATPLARPFTLTGVSRCDTVVSPSRP
jgi:hypothetical protein